MNWNVFRILFFHEMRLLVRSRRTVAMAILLPALVMPLMLLGSRYSNERRQQVLSDTTYRFSITGPYAGRVRDSIQKVRDIDPPVSHRFQFSESTIADPDRALETGDIQFYIRTKDADGAGVPTVSVVFRGNQDLSKIGSDRMVDLLERARRNESDLALVQHGFKGKPRDLFAIDTTDLATRGQMTGLTVGRFITAVLVVLMFTGGSVAALDIVAGEKERGTLETLLTTAAGRAEIVAAKQCAISAVALTITLVQALNFLLYIKLKIVALPAGFHLELSSGMAMALLALFAPLAVMVGSVLLILSARAKSYKEAHLYFFPVYLLSLLLSLAGLLPGIPWRSAIVIVPIANVSVAAREILVGRPDLPMIFITFAILIGWAAWLLRMSVKILAREDIIQPSFAEPAEFTGGSALFGKRVLRWFAVMWAIQFAADANAPQLANIRWQLAFNEVVLLLGGSVLMIRFYKLDVRNTLSLKSVKPVVWLAVLCAIPTANSAAAAVSRLTNIFIPVSQELLNRSSEGLIPPGMPQWQMWVYLALLPAICEEIAFRGLLLSGLKRRMRPVMLAVVVGLIFGFFHMALFRLAPTAVLGVVLTGIALMTGSIFPGMVLHMGNNAWALWAGMHGFDPESLGAWQTAALLAIFTLSMWIIYRNRPRNPWDETHRTRS